MKRKGATYEGLYGQKAQLVKDKISASLKGIKRSPETRLKMSLGRQLLKQQYGYVNSPETRQKMRIAKLGKSNSGESNKKRSLTLKKYYRTHIHLPTKGSGFYSRRGQSRGFYEDLGLYMRSLWEANVARLFSYLSIPYIYEVPIKLSCGTFFVDFYLPIDDIYVEVRGNPCYRLVDKLSIAKMEYPNYNIKTIKHPSYKVLEKEFSKVVPFWNCKPLKEKV